MKNLSVIGVALSLSLSAFAEKECSVNLKKRIFVDGISHEMVNELANELTASTNIKITNEKADYSLEVYVTKNFDHHNTRYSYINGQIEIWPSDQIQSRSAVTEQFHSGFKKNRKVTKQLAIELLTNALSKQLKSCKDIENTIKGTGNGTLSPNNGDFYTTKTGATFERVDSYWKDPSGLMWGEILPDEYLNAGINSPAVKACEDLGARLPTAEEFEQLLSYFPQNSEKGHTLSAQGKFEFNSLFPWSFGLYTTSTRDASGVGHDFHHIAGHASQAMEHWELNVRCVK